MEWPNHNKLMKAFLGFSILLRSRPKGRLRGFEKVKDRLSIYYRSRILERILNTIEPDIVHVLHILDPVIFSVSLLKEHPPMMITDHGMGVVFEGGLENAYGMTEPEHAFRIPDAISLAQCVVSVSEFSKSALLERFDLNERDVGKVKAILNPIQIQKWPLLGKEKLKSSLCLGDKKTMMFSGVSLPFEKKGLGILLESVADDEWLRKNCALLIITTESDGEVASEYMRSAGIEGRVFPPQAHSELSKYYNIADIFVMPSLLEGIGLVYIEALVSGAPVVGFYKSIEELEGELGTYLGEGFDAAREGIQELAEKIKHVLSKNLNRNSLRRVVVENLTWDIKFGGYDFLYKELVTKEQMRRNR